MAAMVFVGWVRPQAVTHRSIGFRPQSGRMLTTGAMRCASIAPYALPDQ